VYCSEIYYLAAAKAVFRKQENSTDGTSGPERDPVLSVGSGVAKRSAQSAFSLWAKGRPVYGAYRAISRSRCPAIRGGEVE